MVDICQKQTKTGTKRRSCPSQQSPAVEQTGGGFWLCFCCPTPCSAGIPTHLSLNITAIAKKDGVTRDPQALMDKYIETIVKEQAEAGDNYVKYSSVQDFYEKNPRCCQMYAWQSPQEYSWGWQSVSRFAATILKDAYFRVDLTYRSRVVDTEPYVEASPLINACAERVVHMQGRAPSYHPPSGTAAFRFNAGHPN